MDNVLDFFHSLPKCIEYAIERGVGQIQSTCVGDLDVIIQKKDFPALLETARNSGLLIYASITYGGARIFLGKDDANLKRVDFDWMLHYRGLPSYPAEYYLNSRYQDQETGLFVLPPKQQAEIIYFIKNCYGGAEKYRGLLEQYGYKVHSRKQRTKFIFDIFRHHPFLALLGKIRYLACYFLRAFFPTGLTISGVTSETLRSLPEIMYFFQDRISTCGNLPSMFEGRFLSRLCVVSNNRFANVDLNKTSEPVEIKRTITAYLRRNRTRTPYSLIKIA